MDFDQGEFNFDAQGPEDGYRKWRQELEAAQRDFEQRWGVILGKHVEVQLNDMAKPLRGMLRIVIGKGLRANDPPELELRGLRFKPGAIQHILQIDAP
jgi:hypothetical protein